MPNANWKVLGDLSMLAAVGLGVLGMRRLSSRDKSHNFEQYHYVARDRALVGILSHLEALQQPEALASLTMKLNTLLELASTSHDAGFSVNRLANEICVEARRMCDAAKTSRDVNALNAAVDLEDEQLSALDTICQNTMRNMLLRRGE
jgi:hypothetical protein